MFLIDKKLVREYEGEPDYYIDGEHLNLLADNNEYRTMFLEMLERESVVVESVSCVREEFKVPKVAGVTPTGWHSKI